MDDLNDIIDLVSEANTDKEKEELAYALSTKSGLGLTESFMFVKTMRLIIENDAVLLDSLLDLVQSIVYKLHLNGALSDTDLKELTQSNEENGELEPHDWS